MINDVAPYPNLVALFYHSMEPGDHECHLLCNLTCMISDTFQELHHRNVICAHICRFGTLGDEIDDLTHVLTKCVIEDIVHIDDPVETIHRSILQTVDDDAHHT